MASESANARTKTSSSTRRGLLRRIASRRPGFLPSEFHAHSRAARREVLLAVRSLLDVRIEQLERPAEEPASSKKTQRVEVE